MRGSEYTFLDWAESCISHPFFTMAVTLEDVISWGLDDIRGSVDVRPFRDAHLEPSVTALDPGDRAKHLDGVGLRLRMFLAGLP